MLGQVAAKRVVSSVCRQESFFENNEQQEVDFSSCFARRMTEMKNVIMGDKFFENLVYLHDNHLGWIIWLLGGDTVTSGVGWDRKTRLDDPEKEKSQSNYEVGGNLMLL